MALTVFAEKMGFFHKGCAGIGVAPVDVCLSPPPGPVPIPYTNVLFAKDLIKGSKTVRIDGEPTFLEDYSETSTSIGDEGGTLGGSVVTGVILGKGYFLVWSMTVQIEGLGVDRHGDLMGQNSASSPYSSPNGGSVAKPATPRGRRPKPVPAKRAPPPKVLKPAGPGASKPVPKKPCEMAKITIQCAHSGSGTGKRGFGPFAFTHNGAKILTNLPKGKEDKPIAVVAGHTDATGDLIKILVTGGPGYTCGKSHPRIRVTDTSTNAIIVDQSGKTSAQFKAKTQVAALDAVSRLSAIAIISHYWFPNKITRTYNVEVLACGVKANKAPGFPGIRRLVVAVSPDTYKLSMSIPDVFARTYNRARTRPLTKGAKWADDPKEDKRWNEGMRDGSKWFDQTKPEYPITDPSEDIVGSISLKRNGTNVSEATSKLKDILKQAQAILDIAQGTFNYINDLVPQIGWKFDVKFAFLAGSLSFEWAAKEGNHNLYYRWWKLEAQLVLVKAEVEVSFGFKGSALGAKLEAVGYLKGGASLPWSASIEATPTGTTKKLGTLTLALTIEGGVRASAGADWVASGEGKVTAGFPFSCQPSVSHEDGFRLDFEWKRDKCVASVTGRIFLGGSFTKQWELYPGASIWKGSAFKGPSTGGVPSPAGTIRRRRRG